MTFYSKPLLYFNTIAYDRTIKTYIIIYIIYYHNNIVNLLQHFYDVIKIIRIGH